MSLNINRLKSAIEAVKYEHRITQGEIADKLGYKTPYLSDVINGRKPISEQLTSKFQEVFPELNTEWLLYGEGEMLKTGTTSDFKTATNEVGYWTPLLPVSAQGGSLNDFTMSVHLRDCEKILSPIKGVDFGIRVSGDSMSPEYPSGSIVLIQKINHQSFIEWGRCYVLDTSNGIVVKKISPPETKDDRTGYDYLNCVSVNTDPIFKPFRVPMSDIIGMYRVKMLLDEK